MKRFLTLMLLPLSLLAFGQNDLALIPYPASAVPIQGQFTLNASTLILHDTESAFEAQQLQSFLKSQCGFALQTELWTGNVGSNTILLDAMTLDPGLQTPQTVESLPGGLGQSFVVDERESYRLSITPTAVVINGRSTAGVAHAVQTLKQLTPFVSNRDELLPVVWPCMMIQDRPAFPHRGLLLDCCRHFMTVDFIKKYIDALAFYKMNVLHWHLTEDQGWRIEIKKYPKLTEVGAYRQEADGTTYGGYYTQEQIKDIVRYAQERHITIIPEIEMPGHSVAAVASYPHLGCTHEPIAVENEWGVFKDIYCAGSDQTIAFLKDVLAEVCELFPGPYIHIGGDEAPKARWEECERCQKRIKDKGLKDEAALQTWLIEEMAAFLQTKNKQIIGWDEILEGGIPAGAAIQSWRGPEGGIAAAKAQHVAIMSPTSHCYFDYGLNSIDAEKVYQFNPIPSELTKDEAQYIRGGECNMWTEHAPQEKVDSKVFPRLLAMSEVLWTNPNNRDYAKFSKRMNAHYPYLEKMSIRYGLPKEPLKLAYSRNEKGQMVISAQATLDNIEIFYEELELYGRDFTLTEDRTEVGEFFATPPSLENYYRPIAALNHSRISFYTSMSNGKRIEDYKLSVCVDQHLGSGKKSTRNFETNRYYPASGDQAFSDGLCYSTGFRDGFWQGVVQKNLEIMVDLDSVKTVQHCNSHWYHYANAWIFRPNKVVYYGSLDGKTWFELGHFDAAIEASDKREMPLPYAIWFAPKKARYVKMVVQGIGACPAWHDAPGEPSWLFGDELIVR